MLALELQAAGQVPHPRCGKGKQAAILAQCRDHGRPEDIPEGVVADSRDRVTGGVVDWPERGGEPPVQQVIRAEQLRHVTRLRAQGTGCRRADCGKRR